jgi:glycyl-tRNA synthetase beta chain
MPAFFLELFCEEIPARMQKAAAEELQRLCLATLADLAPADVQTYYGPRRIAFAAQINAASAAGTTEARGPRENAPDAALNGFLGKYAATREELVTEGGFYWLRRATQPVAASDIIANALPAALAKFSWPKSMRWGQSGDFTWVRPLRRIISILNGEVVPFTLGPVTASNFTEGHRVHAPGAFQVTSAADWAEKLRAHYVIVDQTERRRLVAEGLANTAAARNLTVAPDEGLLDEVTGLVEWPVPLIGQIGAEFMDLPPEVRELSMKVNQKYFALRDASGTPAPYFAFMANLETPDHGATIIAGNERVLRARLSDARHFWDLDLKTPLEALLPKLEKITFHAKIGTQRERAKRIADLAGVIALKLAPDDILANANARTAGLLCKTDLVTGMVGEFPELQGLMGGYYAERDSSNSPNNAIVGDAIKTHYQPKGPSDAVPTGTVAVSVALADKLDTLQQFFAIGEKPTGSGDPFALRRAALGVIRIILENGLRLDLRDLASANGLFDFIIDRLRVKLRGEGQRFDVLEAVLATGSDGDLVRIMRRVEALTSFLTTQEGKTLLAGYKRAANILNFNSPEEELAAGQDEDPVLFEKPIENELYAASRELFVTLKDEGGLLEREDFTGAMAILARTCPIIDQFFADVIVNDPTNPALSLNRVRLLYEFRTRIDDIADFSHIAA